MTTSLAPRTVPRRSSRGVPSALAFLALLLGGTAACDAPRAHGDVHAIVVASNAPLWDAMELEVEDAISPTIQVVRNERTFRVTWQDPTVGNEWGHLRRFRNLVIIGAAGEPWVDDVLEARRRDAPDLQVPSITRVDNVWARNQTVTLVLLPSPEDVEALSGQLPVLTELLDNQYREFSRNRMYVSGRDTLLADSLGRNVGFRLDLPHVYRYSVMDSVFRFRNDNPSPADLIREIAVTWVAPLPETLPGQEEIEAWRQAFTDAYYSDGQVLDTTVTSLREVTVTGSSRPGLEYQAAWQSAPDAWPAGGPLMIRVLPCPQQDRLYFLDAWLYAPSREKYEYMIQLQTILDSFACVGSR